MLLELAEVATTGAFRLHACHPNPPYPYGHVNVALHVLLINPTLHAEFSPCAGEGTQRSAAQCTREQSSPTNPSSRREIEGGGRRGEGQRLGGGVPKWPDCGPVHTAPLFVASH